MTQQDSSTTNNFDILFIKLDEAIAEQKSQSNFEIVLGPEVNETISLFREYQESVMENSFTTFTRG